MIHLTPEQLAIQAMVRALARDKIGPRAREWDERGQFSDELRHLLAEHDLFGMGGHVGGDEPGSPGHSR